MTKYEAAIITAYTQRLIGDVNDYQTYAEKLLGRPLVTTELADDEVIEEIREKARKDFENIKIT